MPTTSTLTVPASELREGDKFQSFGDTVTVVSKETPRSLVHITVSRPVEGGEDKATALKPVKPGAQFTVQRTEPTEAERAEQARNYTEDYITRTIKDTQQNFDKAKANLVEALTIRGDWHASKYESFARLQAEHELWSTVLAIMERREVDLVTATRVLHDKIRDELLEHNPGWSSSSVHTAVNEIAHRAKASWFRDLRWQFLSLDQHEDTAKLVAAAS